MASPLPNVPKVPSSPFSDIAKRIGQGIAAKRPQPSANVGEIIDQWKGGPSSSSVPFALSGHINEKLGQLHDYAKMRGIEGENGYAITGYNNKDEPSDAEIRKTSVDQELAGAYGDAWEKIRDSIIAAPAAPKDHRFQLSYGPWRTADEKFKAPAYVVTRKGDGGFTSALPWSQLVELAPGNRAAGGMAFPDSFALDHEMGHLVAHPFGPEREGYVADVSPGAVVEGMLKDHPELMDVPIEAFAAAVARQNYERTTSEAMALMGQMRRMEYGLTGNKMITPEERIRAVTRWFESKPPKMIDASGHWTKFFEDPVMQEGPRSGQRAHGFEQFRSNGRRFWMNSTPEQKDDFLNFLLPKVGAAETKKESMYA